MIKAIIFDLGGVIIEDKSTPYFRSHQDKVSPQNFARLLEEEHKTDIGKLSDEEFFKKFDECFGKGEAQKLYLAERRCYQRPDKRVLALIKTLKQHYKIGLISNLYHYWVEPARKQPYLKLFDEVIFSSEVGLEKPDKEIYLLAAKNLGVRPDECLFIDDKQRNIDGANVVGMKGVLFLGTADLEKKLREIL